MSEVNRKLNHYLFLVRKVRFSTEVGGRSLRVFVAREIKTCGWLLMDGLPSLEYLGLTPKFFVEYIFLLCFRWVVALSSRSSETGVTCA